MITSQSAENSPFKMDKPLKLAQSRKLISLAMNKSGACASWFDVSKSPHSFCAVLAKMCVT